MKLIEPDPDAVPAVRRIVDLWAAGRPDRAVVAGVGLSLYVVRGVLTSSLFIGRLRDGSAANWGQLVDLTTWNRARGTGYHSRSSGLPTTSLRALMLRCAWCGRRLIGDTGERLSAIRAAAEAARRPMPRLSARVSVRFDEPTSGGAILAGDPPSMLTQIRAFAAVGVEELAVGFEPRRPDAFVAAVERFDREVVQAVRA